MAHAGQELVSPGGMRLRLVRTGAEPAGEVGGEERVYGSGERFEVPPGVRHQMGADEPTTLRWEVRPPLRTAEFFETLYSADGAERADDKAVAGFLAEFSEGIQFTGG